MSEYAKLLGTISQEEAIAGSRAMDHRVYSKQLGYMREVGFSFQMSHFNGRWWTGSSDDAEEIPEISEVADHLCDWGMLAQRLGTRLPGSDMYLHAIGQNIHHPAYKWEKIDAYLAKALKEGREAALWSDEDEAEIRSILKKANAALVRSLPTPLAMPSFERHWHSRTFLFALPEPLPSGLLASGPGWTLKFLGAGAQMLIPPGWLPLTDVGFRWRPRFRHMIESLQSGWPKAHPAPFKDLQPLELKPAPISLKLLRSALAHVDPDCSYDEWIQVGMALHYETGGSWQGFEIYDSWSAGAVKQHYPGKRELKRKWESFGRRQFDA